MGSFEVGQTVVRRDVWRGQVWSEQALRVVEDSGSLLVTACCPGAEALWPALYAKARADGQLSARAEAFDAMAAGRWQMAPAVWQDTDLLLWKPPADWFSINAFFDSDSSGRRRLRNWYINFERPAHRIPGGFDTFDLAVDLVITPDLAAWRWKDEDEYAHARRLGIVSDLEHRAVALARSRALAMLEDRAGPFAEADRWASWRWDQAWPMPRLPPSHVGPLTEEA